MGPQLFIAPIHPGKWRSDIYGLPTLGGNGLEIPSYIHRLRPNTKNAVLLDRAGRLYATFPDLEIDPHARLHARVAKQWAEKRALTPVRPSNGSRPVLQSMALAHRMDAKRPLL
ncbi:hypothetical protein LTS18_014044, partial [Coniosporium uncinatum]